jgi:hypothetical protein
MGGREYYVLTRDTISLCLMTTYKQTSTSTFTFAMQHFLITFTCMLPIYYSILYNFELFFGNNIIYILNVLTTQIRK